jgi:hypothetical protein
MQVPLGCAWIVDRRLKDFFSCRGRDNGYLYLSDDVHIHYWTTTFAYIARLDRLPLPLCCDVCLYRHFEFTSAFTCTSDRIATITFTLIVTFTYGYIVAFTWYI